MYKRQIDYGKMVKNGEVVSTFDTDEYRAYLDYMHKLYADGLLDEEGFAQTNDQFYAKLQSGVVGLSLIHISILRSRRWRIWASLHPRTR